MNSQQEKLNQYCLNLLEKCNDLEWKIEEVFSSVGIKFICHTPVGKIRLTKWLHNGDFNINIFDQLTKVKKLGIYLN